MSRENSPYVVGEFWLDHRPGTAGIWQITSRNREKRNFRYASTRCRSLDDAKVALDAHFFAAKSKQTDQADPLVLPQLRLYWTEKGQFADNPGPIDTSLMQFTAFLSQDEVTVAATFKQLTPSVFARFRRWREAPHAYEIEWRGKMRRNTSRGVKPETVQRDRSTIMAALNNSVNERRASFAPKFSSIPAEERVNERDKNQSVKTLGAIVAYARTIEDKAFENFILAQLATACRPDVVLSWNVAAQADLAKGTFDTHPHGRKRTKKRNAKVAIIPSWKPMLEKWIEAPYVMPKSFKARWTVMRRVLCLDPTIIPKDIRSTVASLLLNDDLEIPSGHIKGQLGHSGGKDSTTERYARYLASSTRRSTLVIETHFRAVLEAADQWSATHLLSKVGNNPLMMSPKGEIVQ